MNNIVVRGLVVAAALAALNLTSTGLHAEDVAEKADAAVAADADTSAPVEKSRDLNVIIKLLSGTKLHGTLVDLDALALETSFGETNIPLAEVAGIRFAPADSASTTIVMLNGDSITGATSVELMTVNTEWGIAEVKGGSIASVMFVTGVEWSSEVGLSGTRWNLTKEKAAAAPKSSSKKNSSSSSNRRSSNRSRTTLFGL